MPWLWMALGASLLGIAWGLPRFLHRRTRRLRIPRPLLGMLRKALRLPGEGADVQSLHSCALPLMEYALRLGRELHKSPALPADEENEPRLLALAHDLADDGVTDTEDLLRALEGWEHPATPSEVFLLPQAVAVAQCQRLVRVLRTVLADGAERAQAGRLFRRMLRSKDPALLLGKAALRTAGLAALAQLARQRDPERLLPILEAWFAEHGLTAEALTEHTLSHQLHLAEELRRAVDCFAALARMNWLTRCHEADALHSLFAEDPAGLYPRLDAASQLALRRQAEALARHVRLDTETVAHQAIALAMEAESGSLENGVCFYFQETEGVRRLQKALPSKRGRLYARFAREQRRLGYAFLWLFGISTGFLFLQGRGPVFMLPFFALVTGVFSRWCLSHFPRPALPRMALDAEAARLRTLVVMPAVLRDSHEAIRMVRRLKTAMHAFPQDVDFLLLGDFAPAITPVSSGDQAVLEAAAAAVSALADSRVMYLHRARTWDGAQHLYAPRAGSLGALTAVCRLIAQGECEDVIALSTVEAAHFERRYDYVLALSPEHQPAPGLYEALFGTMTHPLCGFGPSGKGWRGCVVVSPEGQTLFEGTGLIRPDAFLESTDGLLPSHEGASSLAGELAGHAAVPGAYVRKAASPDPHLNRYAGAVRAWRLLPWQLKLVQTPSGLVGNPLDGAARFRLRERLREALVPLGQCALLLYAVPTGSWPLILLALAPLLLEQPLHRWEDAVRLLCRLSLLPTEAALPLRALYDLLRRRHAPPSLPSLEVWAQGIAAALMTALGLALPGFSVPALALGVAFGCFPLAHRLLDAPLAPAKGVTADQHALLTRAAAATWRYFTARMEDGALPAASVQFEPAIGAENATTPRAIAAALLSCVCAREAELLPANAAAERLSALAEALASLPMPYGLPCRRYALPALTAEDPHVDARCCGFLLCAVMTAAQALRTWLPELAPEFAGLSAKLEAFAASMDIAQLYDPASGLFHEGLDEDRQPIGYLDAFTDEALLLSVAACARGVVPPEHFPRLRRTRVRRPRHDLPLSAHGAASAHLLAGLFLPLREEDASAYIRAMAQAGQNGLFGQDECACFAFDPALHYHRVLFGLPEAAALPVDASLVFAPYAAALCLPFQPYLAAEALARFDALGALGPEGFCDAADLTSGTALVGLHDTYHQGLLLAAVTHLLADAPLRRIFCSLPQVEAVLPLLDATQPPLVLPPMALRRAAHPEQAAVPRSVDPRRVPAEACLLGSADFRMIADAAGNSVLFDGDLPLTHGSDEQPFGVQFYLRDEGRVYRLGSPALPGTAEFAPGEVRLEQVCGSLRAEIVCTVDAVRRRALHIVTLTNLSTRDRIVDLADFLLPDLRATPGTLEALQPERGSLFLRTRETGAALRHTADVVPPPLTQCACTDADFFLGRSGSLHAPAALDAPMEDRITPAFTPCASFRLRLSLGGRGQATAWFTTGAADGDAPAFSELGSIRQLAAMQHSAIAAAAPLTEEQAIAAGKLLPALMRAEYRIALHLSDTASPALRDLAAILARLGLQGVHPALDVSCPEPLQASVFALLGDAHFTAEPQGLLLRDDADLSAQLDASARAFPMPVEVRPPKPGQLSPRRLDHACTCGGFDPETADYLLRLEPGQYTPAPWENRHVSRYYAESAADDGLREPFHGQVMLRLEDGTAFSPWSPELPRSVRFGLNETAWEAWSDTLEVRLTAACLPRHRCGMRVLRLRNTADYPQTVAILVTARLAPDGTIACAPGMAAAHIPGRTHQPFLAGEGWASRRCAFPQAANHLPDDPNSAWAVLEYSLTLAPHASGKCLWLAGFARHSEDIARALAETAPGPSELLREIRSRAARPLATLTVSTPEDTLDLLLNRILPAQALSAGTEAALLPQLFLDPRSARRTLLHIARRASSRDDLARLALLAEAYVRITGDEAVLDVFLSHQEATLHAACAASLTALPLDRDGLPLGDEQPPRCFLYAAAAKALHRLRPDEALAEWSRKLLLAVDTHLWQDGSYGAPLRLDVQCLAALALGDTLRTRQALRTCWQTLYDQPHGLIRTMEPTDAPPLPGSPANGGMRTRDAVLCLHALLVTGQQDEAFELMRALNPLHHTDTPERQASFRAAPFLLHGGMCASPMDAGRAVPDDGAEAAALLYAVMLGDMLGLHREGNVLRMDPHVPPDWEEFTLTLREGASTWRITLERRASFLAIDGKEIPGNSIPLHDDGKIHRVHIPLK